jgi:hypothetical protein
MRHQPHNLHKYPPFWSPAHMLPRDLGSFSPRIPLRKKRSLSLRRWSPFQEILRGLHTYRFQSTTLAATHALIRRIANIAKVGIPSTSTPTNPRSRWGLAFPTFNNPLAATWYTPSILNVKDGSHNRSAKLKTEWLESQV